MTTKEKKRERTKKWKQDNREKINSYNRKYRVENNLEVTRKKQKRDKKAYFVALAGGKCIKCGYSDNISVLEFHHTGVEHKDFTMSAGVKSWYKMKKEADKCDLYCSNCHRLEHSDSEYWSGLMPFVKDYNGKNEELKKLLK